MPSSSPVTFRVPLSSLLGSLKSSIANTWPHYFQRFFFILSMKDRCAFLRRISFSLTYMFIVSDSFQLILSPTSSVTRNLLGKLLHLFVIFVKQRQISSAESRSFSFSDPMHVKPASKISRLLKIKSKTILKSTGREFPLPHSCCNWDQLSVHLSRPGTTLVLLMILSGSP